MRGSVSVRWAVLMLALVATACAGAAEPPEATGSASVTGELPPSPAAPGSGPEILDFQAPLVGGGTFRGAELAGSPVAIWFWAPW